MPFYNCAICQQDGSLLAKDATVVIEETERGGVTEWYGTITGKHLESLVAGQTYRLTLDDGHSGEFFVRKNTSAGETDRAVAIHGAGPLQL